MARTSAPDGMWWCIQVLLFATLLSAGGVNCMWTLQFYATDFCVAIADITHTTCDCVDTQIVPGQGTNLCGAGEALGQGFTVDSSTFTGWSGGSPTPDTEILRQDECDARTSTTNDVSCTGTGNQPVTSALTITYTVGLGLQITLGFSLPDTTLYSFSFEDLSSTEAGNTVTSSGGCDPPSSGQEAGTCTIYTETYSAYYMPDGLGFAYDAVVSGGVQMSFSDPIDALGAIGQGGDGSLHYFWYIPIDQVVTFGQSPQGTPEMNQFDPPSPGNPVTFHGSGTVTGNFFVYLSTECALSDCS